MCDSVQVCVYVYVCGYVYVRPTKIRKDIKQ